jgi:AcrR family transcriptional regulator
MSSTSRPSKTDIVTGFRRSQLLDAARERFATHGLAGTTVDGIARSAGVAKGTVYLYYKSKEEILRHVLEEDLRQLHDATVPVVTGPGPIDDRIRQFIAGALTFFDLKRDFFEQVHFEMGREVRKKAQQQLEVVFRRQVDAWRAALADAQRAGLVGPLDRSAAALMIVAVASGLAKQRLRGWTREPIAAIAERTSALLWKGLAAR